MATTDIAQTLCDLLEPIAERHGYELVAVERAGGRRSPVIRVLLDRPEGIDLAAICEANEWVSAALDAADLIPGPYTLEVSSPGVDRPLRKRSDFERFAGETVTVRTRAPIGTRSSWTGVLKGVADGVVLLAVGDDEVRIAYQDIVKARVKGVVNFDRGRNEDRS